MLMTHNTICTQRICPGCLWCVSAGRLCPVCRFHPSAGHAPELARCLSRGVAASKYKPHILFFTKGFGLPAHFLQRTEMPGKSEVFFVSLTIQRVRSNYGDFRSAAVYREETQNEPEELIRLQADFGAGGEFGQRELVVTRAVGARAGTGRGAGVPDADRRDSDRPQ